MARGGRRSRPLDPRQGAVELDGDVSDLTVARPNEGFGLDPSESVVDEAVDAAIEEFEGLGATVTSVSVPDHADAMPIWLPIIVEGAAATLDSNGAGHGCEGRYDTAFAEVISESWETAADALRFNIKVAALVADYLSREYHGGFYGKARNLRRSFRASYEAAFERADLLALPTTPMCAYEHDPDLSDADRFRHHCSPHSTRARSMPPATRPRASPVQQSMVCQLD